MKINACLTLIPLAAQGALPWNSKLGARGLALVVKADKNDFSYVTRDGGSNSAAFYGVPPKGGSLFRKGADTAKGAVEDVEGRLKHNAIVPDIAEDTSPLQSSSCREKAFKEGGLGFLFGLGTGVCVRKVNKTAAYAMGGAMVAAQYISRADIAGAGGKFGWTKLDAYKRRPSGRDNFGSTWRAGRMLKHTVQESLETCGGYAVGLFTGLKAPLP